MYVAWVEPYRIPQVLMDLTWSMYGTSFPVLKHLRADKSKRCPKNMGQSSKSAPSALRTVLTSVGSEEPALAAELQVSYPVSAIS